MMQYGETAWIDSLSARLESVLATHTGLPPDRIFTSLASEEELCKQPPGEAFVRVMPNTLTVAAGHVTGGASPYTAFDSLWEITCFRRLGADRQGQASLTIRDVPYGIGQLTLAASRAVQMATLSVQERSLLRQPMRLLRARLGGRTPAGWAVSRIDVELLFRADLSAARAAEMGA